MARPSSGFLEPGEYEEFLKPDRVVPRSIVEVRPGDPRPSEAARTDLVTLVSARLRALVQREATWFEWLCVRVRRDDGMSWSAEAVRSALGKEHSQFTPWCLSDRTSPDVLPIVARLVGLRVFLRLAAQHKLTKSFVTLRWWLAPLIVVSIVAGGAIVRIVDVLLKSPPTAPVVVGRLLGDWMFLSLTALAAGVALGIQQLTTFLNTRTRSESLKTFRQDLEAKERSPEYDDFVESLATRLAGWPFPRLVIIDNFEALDATTAKVMLRYFQTHRESARGSEFWIVFEHEDGEKFTSRIRAGRAIDHPSPDPTFRQVELTSEEKTRLIRTLGRPERAADFVPVKLVCHQDDEGVKRWQTVFSQYRPPGRQRPSRYDDLDFLFLLSLTAEPGDVSLGTDDLVSRLARQNVERARVLRQLLPGTNLAQTELRTSLEQMDQKFRAALVFSPDGHHRRVAVEAAEALRAMPATDLAPAGLGHFFWALFWHDRFGPQPRQAYWMRKLAYHARAMDPSALGLPAADPIQGRALDIVLFTAEGCLKTGVFTEVPPLLRKAVDVLYVGGAAAEASRPADLLQLCWKAYWVLGDPDVLAMASEVYELSGVGAPAGDQSSSALERLFLETVSIQAGTAAVRAMASRLSGGAADVSDSVFDYLRARSAWLALTTAPHLMGLGITELLTAALEGLATLDEVGGRAWDRLSSARSGTRVTDAMALSLTLWSSALRAQWPAARLLVISQAPREAVFALARALGPALSSLSDDDDAMPKLVATARNAVRVAGKLTGESPTAGETDFPLSGLARELCAIAIASITAAHAWLARTGGAALRPPEIGQIADIVTEINSVLGTSLPVVTSSEDLRSPAFVSSVDRLLLGCEILWQTFELAQLRDAISVRRAQFNGMCVEITPENFRTHARAVQAIRCLEAGDLFGLMANLVVADRLRNVTALATPYAVRAGRIALQDRFGVGLRREMALMVVLRGTSTTLDLGEFIEDLLGDAAGATERLARVLASLAPEAFCGCALRFIEAARASALPGLEARCRLALAPAAAKLAEPVRREVEALLDVSALREQVQMGATVQPATVLEAWRERRDLWTYPWVLEMLLQEGHEAPEVLTQSVAILQRDPAGDGFNTYLHLALALGQREVRRPATRAVDTTGAALTYLKGGFSRWESELPPETNVRAFRVLETLDPGNREAYRAGRSRWEYLKLELDHVQRLPALLDQGRFFDIFGDYYTGMEDWGLVTDASNLRAFHIEHLNAPAEERQRVVRAWIHAGGTPPSPWGEVQGQRAVSLTFIALGRFLFAPPLDGDPGLADVRTKFNDAAQSALPELLRMVMALPRLPSAFKELVGRFQGRFREYTALGP